MTRLLVTGGLGFIGSNFIRLILATQKQTTVVNLDNESRMSNNQNPISDEPRYRFTKGDICDGEIVRRLLQDADIVVNFAAETHVDRSIADPIRFLKSNTVGTFSLLEAARKLDSKRFVHISTDEVYGQNPSGPPTREEGPFQPSSPYAASKAAADSLVQAFYRTYGLDAIILRCSNNFGPYQHPEKFVPKAIICSLLQKPIPIYGSGKQVRDWIYVTDFCRAVTSATERAPSGSIYNVSAGNEMANLDLANRILDFTKKSRALISHVEDRPAHDVRYSISCQKIKDTLGWKPEFEFDDALRKTVEWYVRNETWWKPLALDVLPHNPWKENWE